MKISKKLLINAISVMLIVAVAATVITYSLADKYKNADKSSDLSAPGTGTTEVVDSATNVDNIITRSNLTGEAAADDDVFYHVVEIYSGSPSALKSMCEYNITNANGDETSAFEEYVLTGNKTTASGDAIMNPKHVIYHGFKASSISGLNVTDANGVTYTYEEALAIISNADFTYVSNTSGQNYSVANDIPEDVYQILNPDAVGKYKPLMIDGPTKSEVNPPSPSDKKTVTSLVTDVFDPNGKYYYTFKYNTASVDDFYSHSNGSMYLAINGDKVYSKWTEAGTQANFLVISKSGSDTTLTNKLMSGTTPSGDVYTISGSLLETKGYKGNQKPATVKLTKVSLAAFELGMNTDYKTSQYDMIILENDLSGKELSESVYNMLASAMYGNIHVIYDASLASDTTPTTPGGSDVDYTETNYHELFYNVATAQEIARYENIMVTNKNEVDILAASNNAATLKVIADLINSSSYRGIGGPGAAASKYTVLEIQPCYPIDTAVATDANHSGNNKAQTADFIGENANYYLKPVDVVNNTAKEDLPEGTEYYAWELTKANVADMTGLDESQINIVHMSTEELACSKTKILGNYDMIYIGGNTTALKDMGQYRSMYGALNSYKTISGQTGTLRKDLPIYVMYSHTSDIIDVSVKFGQSGTTATGTELAKVDGNGDGKQDASFSVMNGNDITYAKYLELIEYIDAGMPVIVSKKAAEGYEAVKDFGYGQNSIDPDSNICKVLKKLYEKDDPSDFDQIAWKFNNTDTTRIDASNEYGYYTVFNDDPKELGKKAYDKGTTRPKITVTSKPKTYNLYDKSTRLDSKLVKFTFKVAGSSNYSTMLYVDKNGDSVFDSSEVVGATATSTTLTAALEQDGPIYYQLLVKDKNNKTTAAYTDICYIKSDSNDPKQVRVLQIIPGDTNGDGQGEGEGAVKPDSLYFCTTCQQAYQRLDTNPYANGSIWQAEYLGNYEEKSNNGYMRENKLLGIGVYLGEHEHDFGIPLYDSTKKIPSGVYGADNWDSNIVDELEGLYEFDFDILLRNEYEAIAKDIQNAYNTSDAQKQSIVANFVSSANGYNGDKYSALSAQDKADFDALTTTDEKYVFVQRRYYASQYEKYRELYNYMISEHPEGSAKKVDDNGNEIELTSFEANAALKDAFKRMKESIETGAYETLNNVYMSASYKTGAKKAFTDGLRFKVTVNGSVVVRADQVSLAPNNKYMTINVSNGQYANSSVSGGGFDGGYGTVKLTINGLQEGANIEVQIQEGWGSVFTIANGTVQAGGTFEYQFNNYTDLLSAGDIAIWNYWNAYDFNSSGSNNLSKQEVIDRLAYIIGTEKYYQYYSIQAGKRALEHDMSLPYLSKLTTVNGKNVIELDTIDGYYMDYVNAKALEHKFKNLAKQYERYMYYEDWIKKTYDCVVLGASENFANDNFEDYVDSQTTYSARSASGFKGQGLRDLVQYVEEDGQVLLFHDTMSGYSDAGNCNLTKRLRGLFGMERFPMEVDTTVRAATGNVPYVAYTAKGTTEYEFEGSTIEVDNSDIYFMTNLSNRNNGNDRYTNWVSDMSSWGLNNVGSFNYYLTNVQYTDAVAVGNTLGDKPASLVYKYAEFSWAQASYWNQSSSVGADNGQFGTDRATQNNKGKITMYPYTLGDKLNISGTHPQAYALDVEKQNLTVWYSLAGGTNNKAGSSVHAASPNDGTDSYFIYSYGNIFYCGAGHSKVTGIGKDNNDERRLYINIICNSVEGKDTPVIKAYDYEKSDSAHDVVKTDDEGASYYINVDSESAYPEFSFDVRVGSTNTITGVRVFYDVNVTDETITNSPYTGASGQYLIADYGKNVIKQGERVDIGKVEFPTDLQLKSEYFNGRDYVYVVIEVSSSNGTKGYKRIKIKLKPYLFDLT